MGKYNLSAVRYYFKDFQAVDRSWPLAFTCHGMPLFLQPEQTNVPHGLYTQWNARLGFRLREGLVTFFRALRPCANPPVLRVKEGAEETATERGKKIPSHVACHMVAVAPCQLQRDLTGHENNLRTNKK